MLARVNSSGTEIYNSRALGGTHNLRRHDIAAEPKQLVACDGTCLYTTDSASYHLNYPEILNAVLSPSVCSLIT